MTKLWFYRFFLICIFVWKVNWDYFPFYKQMGQSNICELSSFSLLIIENKFQLSFIVLSTCIQATLHSLPLKYV